MHNDSLQVELPRLSAEFLPLDEPGTPVILTERISSQEEEYFYGPVLGCYAASDTLSIFALRLNTVIRAPRENIELDLSHHFGRDWAARFIVSQRVGMSLRSMVTAPNFTARYDTLPDTGEDDLNKVLWWSLTCREIHLNFSHDESFGASYSKHPENHIPELAGITDPVTALHIICLHVAGR